MNKTLLKANMKANWGVFTFISGMLLIYVATSISMFDPESAGAIESMFEYLPEGMMKAFGFENMGTDLTSYLGGYLYGFILLMFPLIYTVIVSNSLVVRHVDKGSMAYLLTTPNSRVKIITTQAVYLVASIFVLFAVYLGLLIAVAEMIHPGLLDIGPFLVLNLVTIMVSVVVGGIGFLFSCLMNESRRSLSFGAAIPIIFIVLKMVMGISEDLEVVKYFTIYSLINVDKILHNTGYGLGLSGLLALVAIVIYSASIYAFNKRSLTI